MVVQVCSRALSQVSQAARPPLPSGRSGVAFLELGEEPVRPPAEAQREVAGVHAEVVEHAAFAAGRVEAFPVRRLGRIEIAAVMETGDHLQNSAQATTARGGEGPLGAGKKRHLGTAPDKATAGLHRLENAPGRAQIHAERFLREQILSRRQHVADRCVSCR